MARSLRTLLLLAVFPGAAAAAPTRTRQPAAGVAGDRSSAPANGFPSAQRAGASRPVSIDVDKWGVASSALVAAAIGLAYRSARMKTTRRWRLA